MKAIVTKIFSIFSIIAFSQPCQAEQTSEKEIIEVFMDYISDEEAYSIDWPASMAETGKLLRNYNHEGGKAFLAFVIRGNLSKMGPRLPALSHHEAINKRIGDADYEFVWAAPMVLPDKRTETFVFVRPRKLNP